MFLSEILIMLPTLWVGI